MDEENSLLKKKVCKNRVFLTETVRYDDIKNYLRQDLLSIHDDEMILKAKTSRDKMGELLDILDYRGPNAYSMFVSSLKGDYSHAVKQIEKTVVEDEEKPIPDSDITGAVGSLSISDDRKGKVLEEFLEEQSCTEVLMRLSQRTELMDGWKMFSRRLGVKDGDIRELEHRRDSLQETIYQMLVLWQNQNKRSDTTNRKLHGHLTDAGMVKAAEEMCSHLKEIKTKK